MKTKCVISITALLVSSSLSFYSVAASIQSQENLTSRVISLQPSNFSTPNDNGSATCNKNMPDYATCIPVTNTSKLGLTITADRGGVNDQALPAQSLIFLANKTELINSLILTVKNLKHPLI
ncbi:hypothetical protein D5018_21490 [Parashewanella curva]|uniref:Uncharacterized protein n=1 Tax=Parashewanella curva TaxID=2338552 RepID=A0A3L8PQE8_9GAMM|nr:hypothetical protein [Parashewanella curva]RLV57645.1 hypothetical protein D5018_21490 [Parashewanella curva]